MKWSGTCSGSPPSINQNPYVEAMMVNTGGGGGAQNNSPVQRPADSARDARR